MSTGPRQLDDRPCRDTWLRLVFLCALALATGCQSLNLTSGPSKLRPSNDRDWQPAQSKMPFAEIDGTQYKLRSIRDCNYLSTDDFVVNYVDRTIDLSQVQSVDFVMVPFGKTNTLAHTMLSFGLDDGTYLSVSVEVRKEVGEKYNPVLGVTPKYELIYVLGEERDLIRLRTQYYQAQVYVFPTVASPAQSRLLFADMVNRMNGLLTKPEFYNSITNNCTTNLKDHVNKISPQRIRENAWQVLLPGFSAEYAYKIGLLDNRIPYADLESIAHVNDLAKQHLDSPNFSQAIRSNRHLIERAVVRQQQRESTPLPGAAPVRSTAWRSGNLLSRLKLLHPESR